MDTGCNDATSEKALNYMKDLLKYVKTFVEDPEADTKEIYELLNGDT